MRSVCASWSFPAFRSQLATLHQGFRIFRIRLKGVVEDFLGVGAASQLQICRQQAGPRATVVPVGLVLLVKLADRGISLSRLEQEDGMERVELLIGKAGRALKQLFGLIQFAVSVQKTAQSGQGGSGSGIELQGVPKLLFSLARFANQLIEASQSHDVVNRLRRIGGAFQQNLLGSRDVVRPELHHSEGEGRSSDPEGLRREPARGAGRHR